MLTYRIVVTVAQLHIFPGYVPTDTLHQAITLLHHRALESQVPYPSEVTSSPLLWFKILIYLLSFSCYLSYSWSSVAYTMNPPHLTVIFSFHFT